MAAPNDRVEIQMRVRRQGNWSAPRGWAVEIDRGDGPETIRAGLDDALSRLRTDIQKELVGR